MTLWNAVLLACIACVVLKMLGYLAPPHWLDEPRPGRIADLLTVALLGALVAVQALGAGMSIVIDARLPALAVAGLLLALRAPFLVVVLSAALVAALLRALGWSA